MTELTYLIPIALAFAVVTVSPGPANIAVATTAVTRGRRSGMRYALGLTLGMSIWGGIAASGMGVILQSSANALFALKIIGGLYLIWLAFQSARPASRKTDDTLDTRQTNSRELWQGFLLNLSNPKAVFAWLAALAVGTGQASTSADLWLATAVCVLISYANYAGYAAIFSLPKCMAFYQSAQRYIDGIVAGLFGFAGIGLIRSAMQKSD